MVKKDKLFFGALCAMTLGVMLILLFSHTYNDIVITTRHGINFWTILKNGDILQFYQLNEVASGNAVYDMVQGCAYNILVYLVFAVWNIPLALLEVFTNLDIMNNVFCLAYAKLLPVAAMAVSAVVVRKILILLKVPEDKLWFFLYLYLSSTLMISVVFVMSQYDILSVVCQLLGVQAFLEKKDKKFIFWFGIAFCFKYFSLILFLPLLLLRYKKIFAWIGSLLGMLVPFIVTNIPFLLTASDLGKELTESLFGSLLQYSGENYNLFIILYMIAIVWCYFRPWEDGSQTDRENAVWVSFAAYAAFFGLLNAYPYWSIMMAPFLVFVMALSFDKLYINLLLETFGLAALAVGNMCKNGHCFFGDTMKSMMMSHIVSEDALNYVGSLIHHLMGQLKENFWAFPVLNSVFIAAMALLAVISYPRKNSVPGKGMALSECYDVIFVRFCVTSVVCMMPVLSLFI